MVNKVTSYTDTAGTAVKNEVAMVFNDFAQLTSDEQAHAGIVGSAPKVQYGYVDGTDGITRRTTVTYPTNTNVLTYSYAGTDANKLSRVEKLTFNSGGAVEVVDYTYFGLGGVAKTNYPQPATSNTMASGSSFSGFDRFGRVIDVLWTNSTFGDLAQLKYGYDRVSNRTYRQDVRAASFGKKYDELYGYDNLRRLRAFDRGALDGTPLDHISTPTKRQTWNLDPTGNWNGFTSIAEGTPLDGLVQNRNANTANEVTAIGATLGDIWETPAHDRNGNMTTMPKPSALTDGYNAKYDAWNRLVNITETTGGATVATYEYDGLNRRTLKVVSGTTTHFYYSDAWQVLEERLNALTTANEQFVWGIRYIDDLVLRDHATHGRMYALQDANWNVVALIDVVPDVLQRFVYDAYGTSTPLDDDFTPYTGIDYKWEYRFTGRRIDLETGLYYYRERYYHTGLGRFISCDPSGFIDGANRFAYVANNPIIRLDASGKEWTVKRDGHRRATVISEPDDTVEDLAKMLNYDAKNYVMWLKTEAGTGKAFPTSATAKIGARATFSVPNTVFIGVGSMWFAARMATGNKPSEIATVLQKKGYRVIYKDYDRVAKWSDKDLEKANGKRNDLYGLVFFGHGAKKGKLLPFILGDRDQLGDSKVNGTYVETSTFLNHSLALLILKSCYAANGKWPNKPTEAANEAGTVWLANKATVVGFTSGMMKAVNAAPGP